MPELPEVETIVRDLRHVAMGRLISSLILRSSAIDKILQVDPDRFYQGIMTQTIITVLRKGKYIIMPLDNDNVLVFHLGMTGRLLIIESPDISFEEQLTGDAYVDKHTHLVLELIDPSGEKGDVALHFNDVRMFGHIWLVENVQNVEQLDVPGLRDLGPDALGISLDEFEGIMDSQRSVKAIILDQSKIAGVGNIYADEACFMAAVHPSLPGKSLSGEQLAKLWFAVKTVLKQGIKYRGSSTSDYTTIDGSRGSYQDHHRVYGKTGQKCVECGTIIERIKVIGRSTHFCPTCQQRGTE